MAALFFGVFEHQIDDKSRVSIPARFREQCGDEPLVVMGGWDPCLWIMPEPVANEVRSLFSFAKTEWKEQARILRLRMASTGATVKPDSQGRVYLTDAQKTYAGLDRRALVVGNFDRIEIWEKERYEEHLSKQEGMDMGDVASRVLGPEKRET